MSCFVTTHFEKLMKLFPKKRLHGLDRDSEMELKEPGEKEVDVGDGARLGGGGVNARAINDIKEVCTTQRENGEQYAIRE